MTRCSRIPFAVAALAAAADACVFAAPQDAVAPDTLHRVPVHRIRRTAIAPVIDGRLDDAAWTAAACVDDFRQVEPVEGGVPSERTEMLLLYDADFLYVAFRCLDRDPGAIVGTQMRREADLGPDDRISFVVDPFFDRRNAFFFEMNPAGARGDALIEDNTRIRKDWDGIWYGRASIDDRGWFAEIAIPFKTISFDPGTTRWSFNATRFIRRRNESVRWASPSRDTSFNSIADAGIIEGIHDIRQGAGLDVKPYGLTTLKRDHAGDRDGVDVDAGLDVFLKFTPQLTLSLTINTDFAETEVDDRQVNLTRFPLFFPERRDFFLQDAGIFNFGGINVNPLPFHSRRIGLGPNGETIDILAGAKLTGRVGNLNLGLLDVQMKHDPVLGDKNLLVARASVNVLEQSTIGGIFTYGDPRTPDENWVGGLDFNYRSSSFLGDKTLEGHAWVLHSDSTNMSSSASYGLKLAYPNDRVSWRMGYSLIDDDLDAALGFVPRRGIHEYFANWRYRWRPKSDVIRSIDTAVDLFLVTDLSEDVESRDLEFDILRIDTHAGDAFQVSYSLEREVLADGFEISDGIVIPVGDYRFDRYSIGASSSAGRPVDVSVSWSGGDFFSGTRDAYVAGASWRVSNQLTIGGDLEFNDVRLDEGRFITRLVRTRAQVYFTPDLSWTTFLQFDNGSETLGVNSRVHWIIEPGNELFVVLNQSADHVDRSFRVRQTELTTKVGWTFRF